MFKIYIEMRSIYRCGGGRGGGSGDGGSSISSSKSSGSISRLAAIAVPGQ